LQNVILYNDDFTI